MSVSTQNNEMIIWQSRPSLFFKWPLHLFIISLIFLWFIYTPDLLDFIYTLEIINVKQLEILTYIWTFFVFALLVWLMFSLLKILTIKYRFSNQRIFLYEGIFSRTREEIELYRLKDYKIVSPFHLRIFGISNILVYTSDHSTPVFFLFAIKNAEEVTNNLRLFVERNRIKFNVRQFD